MKFVRFEQQGESKYGVLNGNTIQIVSGDIFADYKVTNQTVSLADVKLLAPCVPSKAVCIGLNYKGHAKEMGQALPKEPCMFIKPSTALNNPEGILVYPPISENMHFEAELAVVIKKTAKNVPEETALDYVLGYTCANDVTARDLQARDGQWTRGKGFDTFLPLGPCIETDIDPHAINIKAFLNGEMKQSSNTSDLIFKVPHMIHFISQVMTLNPGDVILTGTPSGVGPMQVGDEIVVELEGIGRLKNKVGK